MTSGYGLFMLGLRRARRPARPAPTAADRAAAASPRRCTGLVPRPSAGAGIATYGNPFTAETLLALPRFIVDGMATAFGSARWAAARDGGRLVDRRARRLGRSILAVQRRSDPAARHRLPPGDRRRVHDRRRSSGRSSTSTRPLHAATRTCPGSSRCIAAWPASSGGGRLPAARRPLRILAVGGSRRCSRSRWSGT